MGCCGSSRPLSAAAGNGTGPATDALAPGESSALAGIHYELTHADGTVEYFDTLPQANGARGDGDTVKAAKGPKPAPTV